MDGGPMKSFEVHVERRQHYAVVRLVGELDLAVVRAVEDALSPLEKEFGEVIIDLREVEFMDSVGLRVILSANARARSDGFSLRIIKGGNQVQKLLALTRMDEHLTLIDPSALPEAG
jgi:anti-anti-sigma factor